MSLLETRSRGDKGTRRPSHQRAEREEPPIGGGEQRSSGWSPCPIVSLSPCPLVSKAIKIPYLGAYGPQPSALDFSAQVFPVLFNGLEDFHNIGFELTGFGGVDHAIHHQDFSVFVEEPNAEVGWCSANFTCAIKEKRV